MNNIGKIVNSIISKIKKGELDLNYKNIVALSLLSAEQKIACSDIHMVNDKNEFFIYNLIKGDDENSFNNAKPILTSRFSYFMNMETIGYNTCNVSSDIETVKKEISELQF